MAKGTGNTWRHASLSLSQRAWPGTKESDWIATANGTEMFRTADLLAAMDRLGADGWELVTFAPAWGDRSAAFYFKMPPGESGGNG